MKIKTNFFLYYVHIKYIQDKTGTEQTDDKAVHNI